MQHFVILYFIILIKVKTQPKHKKKICAMHWEGAVTDQTCQKWFVKFHARDFSWMMHHSWVDQLKLIEIKLKH